MQSDLEAIRIYERLRLIQKELLAFQELRDITNNRFLFIGKVNPATLEDLAFIKSKNLSFTFFKFLALIPPLILIRSVYEFLRNCVSRLLVPKLSLDSTKANVVILSHANAVNSRSVNSDPFFDQLENDLAKFTNVKTYNLPQDSLVELWRSRHQFMENQKLSKNIGFTTFVGILIQNVSNVLIILKIVLFSKNLSIETRVLLTRAAHDQMSRASFNDLIITAELKIIIRLMESKALIITYEGHPFELTILNEIPKVFPKIKIIAYQHAPIVGSQLSFFMGLSYFTGNVYLATSGQIPKHISVNSNSSIAQNIFVLGSPKFSSRSIGLGEQDSSSQFLRVLLAPEASLEAVIEALAGTNRFLENYKNAKLVLRLHPRLRISDGDSFGFVRSNPGLAISENTLEFDLMHADVCVYRSSAVCFQGMHYGVVPYYCSNFAPSLLDPLYLVSENKLFGPVLSEQYEDKGGLNSRELLINLNGKRELQVIADRYFSSFSIDSIKELIAS